MTGDFTTTCNDYGDKKGCKQEIVMKVVGTKPDGKPKYAPHNKDGTEHKHSAVAFAPQKTLEKHQTMLVPTDEWVREIAREEAIKVVAEWESQNH